MQMLELGRELSAVILREQVIGNEGRVIVFDKRGRVIFEQPINTDIIDMRFEDRYNYLYFLARTGVYRASLAAGRNNISALGGLGAGGLELFIPRADEYGAANYDETARRIIFAGSRYIILAGLSSINILAK